VDSLINREEIILDLAAPGSHQPPAPVFPEYTLPAGMSRGEFRGMGTTISVLLPEDQMEDGMQVVRNLFYEWEQSLSRFLPESELTQLNQRTGESVIVSELLYHVLTTALTAAQATGGWYDPTLHDQLVQLGYDRTFDDLPADQPNSHYTWSPGGEWRGIKVNRSLRLVTLPQGVKLDFGGIAKGMAVDAALKGLHQNGVSSALVNAGGDLAVSGLPPNADHWPVAVPGRDGCWTIPLHHGAIATSGIARRHWRQGNILRHHLLDPRTGMPAESDLWSVTVVATCCEQAEVAAKVAFILGSRQGAEFLRKHHIAGLLGREDGTWETVEPWPVQLIREEL